MGRFDHRFAALRNLARPLAWRFVVADPDGNLIAYLEPQQNR
jgi:hypothetical protein